MSLQVLPSHLFREEGGTLLPYDGAPGNDVLLWHLPVSLRCPPVMDTVAGTELSPMEVTRFGAVVTRVSSSGNEQVWNEEAESWAPINDLFSAGRAADALELLPLEFVDTDPAFPWQGMVFLADEERYLRTGAPGFPPGYPLYGIRCYFEQDANSTPRYVLGSSSIALATSGQEVLLAGVDIDRADEPEWIRFYIKDPSQRFLSQRRSELLLRRDGGTPIGIQLRHFNGAHQEMASLVLHDDGRVELVSQPGSAQEARLTLAANGDASLSVPQSATVTVHDHLEITRTGNEVALRSTGNRDLRLIADGSGDVVVQGDLRVTGTLHVPQITDDGIHHWP